jgi:hypothetical protein
MTAKYLDVPQMLLIGSTGRNSGKTTLAIALIRQWKNEFPVIGLKVTTIQESNGESPGGGEGCGVCAGVNGKFELIEEINPGIDKDTSRLLAAGAKPVLWLKSLKDYLYDGISFFMAQTTGNTLIVCESNSLRNVVNPGTFIMLNNLQGIQIKKSAGDVMAKADLIIDYDFTGNISGIIEKMAIQQSPSGLTVKIKDKYT